MVVMTIIPRQQILHRRSIVANYMSSNVTNPPEIFELMIKDFPRITTKTIANDIRVIAKSEAGNWINDLAAFGYAFQCKRVVNKLLDMEKEVETQRKTALEQKDLQLWKMLTTELRNILKEQVETIGNGPTLMKLKELSQE